MDFAKIENLLDKSFARRLALFLQQFTPSDPTLLRDLEEIRAFALNIRKNRKNKRTLVFVKKHTNPGGLPFGQTIQKALSGFSKLRNRVIGRVFRELKLIEQWGSGLQRILEVCKKEGPATSFYRQSQEFQLQIFFLLSL